MRPPDGGRARVLGVATAVPDHCVDQREAKALARELFAGHFRDVDRLLRVFTNVEVDTRYFAVPPEWFADEHDLSDRNTVYAREAVRLSVESARTALGNAGVDATRVDAILFVSSTGFATPSLDSVLISELGLRPDVRRERDLRSRMCGWGRRTRSCGRLGCLASWIHRAAGGDRAV